MNLLAPGALALAAVAIPIVALYILKMRRPPRVVPSTFLWEQALHDVQANAPWQRLRPNLLLLLQLLAVAALVLALARPFVLRAAAARGDVVAVLDASALMGATDVAPSRFAGAKARIGALIDGLPPDNVMSIVLMARQPHVLIAQSGDHGALHAALDRAATTYETPDPTAALNVATALARGGKHATLFVYTAAGDPTTAPPLLPGVQVENHQITLGAGLRDLGIVAFAASRDPDGTVTVLTRVANLGQRYVAGDLVLDAATGDPSSLNWRAQVDLRPLGLAPGASRVLTRTRLPANTVAVRAHLQAADSGAIDDLAADDRAWAVVPTVGPRRVLLVTPGNEFLRLSLSLAPGVHVDTVAPDAYNPSAARCADLVAFDSYLPSTLPAASVLAVAPPTGPRSPMGLAVSAPVAVTGLQAGDDPLGLLADTGADAAPIDYANPLSVPTWGYPVLRSRGTAPGASGAPVLVAGQNGTRREAVLGFSLFNTTWVLQPGFPILVGHLLDDLAPPSIGLTGVYRPGDPVTPNPAPCASSVSVVAPDGARLPAALSQPFVGASQPGLYTVEQQTPNGARRGLFAVNPFPAPPAALPAQVSSGAPAPAAEVARAEVPFELAPFVAAVALLILSGEWWVAARRR